MSPLVALAVVVASAAGLVLFRRESLASRRALSALRPDVGGQVSGGLIDYPILRFELNGHPAWIGATRGGFGDHGVSGSSTLCRIDFARPAKRRRVGSAAELAALTPATRELDSRRHRAVVDDRFITVEVGGVCEGVAEYSSMVAIAQALLVDEGGAFR